MDMGVLGKPITEGLLKPPQSQNQQYHYSSLFGKISNIGQNFDQMNPYFSSGFKKIGVNDPVFKSNQVFYDTRNDGFSRKQNQLQNVLQNPVAYNYNSKTQVVPNNLDDHNKIFNNMQGTKFRGSFCQKNNQLPDTPVFKNKSKRASNLRKILEKRDHEDMTSNTKTRKTNEMLNPGEIKKKSKKVIKVIIKIKNQKRVAIAKSQNV